MPNVTIGAGAVVAAGQVAPSTRSVAPLTMVQGNPAKPIARCGIPLGLDTPVKEFLPAPDTDRRAGQCETARLCRRRRGGGGRPGHPSARSASRRRRCIVPAVAYDAAGRLGATIRSSTRPRSSLGFFGAGPPSSFGRTELGDELRERGRSICSSTSIRSTSSTRPCWRRRESAASTSPRPAAPVRGLNAPSSAIFDGRPTHAATVPLDGRGVDPGRSPTRPRSSSRSAIPPLRRRKMRASGCPFSCGWSSRQRSTRPASQSRAGAGLHCTSARPLRTADGSTRLVRPRRSSASSGRPTMRRSLAVGPRRPSSSIAASVSRRRR